MAILGVVLNIWSVKGISPDILLAGMISGLSSTGLHQAFKNIIGGDNNEKSKRIYVNE